MTQSLSTLAPGTLSGPVLSYNLPQAVSYSGDGFIELRLDSSYFVASTHATPPTDGSPS
jgi:hypothetical protein